MAPGQLLSRRSPPCFLHSSWLLYSPIPKWAAPPSRFPKGLGPVCISSWGNPGPSSAAVNVRNPPSVSIVSSSPERANRAALVTRFSATVKNRPWSSSACPSCGKLQDKFSAGASSRAVSSSSRPSWGSETGLHCTGICSSRWILLIASTYCSMRRV